MGLLMIYMKNKKQTKMKKVPSIIALIVFIGMAIFYATQKDIYREALWIMMSIMQMIILIAITLKEIIEDNQ